MQGRFDGRQTRQPSVNSRNRSKPCQQAVLSSALLQSPAVPRENKSDWKIARAGAGFVAVKSEVENCHPQNVVCESLVTSIGWVQVEPCFSIDFELPIWFPEADPGQVVFMKFSLISYFKAFTCSSFLEK